MIPEQMTPDQRRAFCREEAKNWLAQNQKRAGELVDAEVCTGCLNEIYGKKCGGKIESGYCAAKTTSHHR